MKTVKKATIALIVLGSLIGAGALVAVTVLSVWANKPRGVRIHLDEE